MRVVAPEGFPPPRTMCLASLDRITFDILPVKK